MKRNSPEVTFTVVDPNPPEGVRKLLKAVIVEKLLAGERGGR